MMKSDNDVELSDGGCIEFPEADGTIRYRDQWGNCEDIRRPGDEGYTDWLDLFDVTKCGECDCYVATDSLDEHNKDCSF